MSEPKIAELITKAIELGAADEAAARAVIKAKNIRSFKRLAEVLGTKTTAAVTTPSTGAVRRTRRATGILHNEGPRGFKMGPVWLASVKAARGVAVKPSNKPKLIKTAAAYGVDVAGLSTVDELCAAIAPKL